jgi:hypothetical protein
VHLEVIKAPGPGSKAEFRFIPFGLVKSKPAVWTPTTVVQEATGSVMATS